MKFFRTILDSLDHLLSRNTLAYAAAFLGLSLGLAYTPAADKFAEMRTYGKDTEVVLDQMVCLMIGGAVLPEIAQAKLMGVSKRQYFAYVMQGAKDVHPSRVPYVEQYLFYLDRAWHSADGGEAVIGECFGRAEKEQEKNLPKTKTLQF